MPRFAVLGAGMSGLIASKAIQDAYGNRSYAYQLDIYDKCVENVSQQKGLHYLHGSCNLPLDVYRVENLITGGENLELDLNVQYSIKVWGNDQVLNNSIVNLPHYSDVYNFREAYDMLKKTFSGNIYIKDIDRDFVRVCQVRYDMVISTIPLNFLFPNVKCESETVYAINCLPRGEELKDFTVMYNLDMSVPWYRASNIFGQTYTEFVGSYSHGYPTKKIKTQTELDINEVLETYGIFLAGRFGQWNRKKLVHEVYSDVIAAISDYRAGRVVNLIK